MKKWLHVEWHGYSLSLVLIGSRYGTELHREYADSDVSGYKESLNRQRASSAMEKWAEANGFAGLIWENTIGD